MTRSKRMKPVSDISATRERDAVRNLAQVQRELAEQQQRLAELMRYRDEYAQRFALDLSTGLDAIMVQDYRAFLARLNAGIDQQKHLILSIEERCEQQRAQWLETRTRMKVIEKVIGRYQQQEKRDEQRKEQKETDEYSQRNKS